MLVLLLTSLPALAEDGLIWAGVAGDSGLRVGPDGPSALVSQVEFDFRAAKGPLFFRLDLDAHVDPNDPFYTYPIPPEEAFLQIGRGAFRVRAGVSNPNIGLSEWDSWDNYLPTHPLNFELMCGQVLGADVGTTVGAWEFAAFGGQDLAWGTPVVGAYAATEGAVASTWSGINVWPGMGYYAVLPAVEFYPADWLWLDVDGIAALADGSPFAGGQLVANLFPESQPNPVLRVQKLIDPDDVTRSELLGLDLPDTSMSFALNLDPTDYLRLSGEGRVEWRDGAQTGMGILYVAFHPPEPEDDFATIEDESAAEE